TVDIMNEYFISIKIDREERPDLDHYFMNAVQFDGCIRRMYSLNVFLTPEAPLAFLVELIFLQSPSMVDLHGIKF
ncbi:MAG: DUF255 domain-containing protein, partial [Saprospiraceae bacterium]|nr:DUF255 domain-containing protein [Saprospiraceae bacterium]